MRNKTALGTAAGCLVIALGALVLSARTPAFGLQTTTQALSIVPRGCILMWSGTLASIPGGWQLCDGTNGTPNLQDRFLLGVVQGQDPGEVGGAHNRQLDGGNLPRHDHSFTTEYAGTHQHTIADYVRDYNIYQTGTSYPSPFANSNLTTMYHLSDPNGSHQHTGTTDHKGDSTLFDNRPAYYRLAFIMKL